MNRNFIRTILLLLMVFSASAQSPYKKKVVSYVDMVIAPSTVQLTSAQTEFIRRSIAKNISFARFSYAPLPENIITAFGEQLSHVSNVTVTSIQSVITSTLAPKLLEILDINKELLSKQNLSEAERNTFLATKAQAAGLTASQLESILNSGFFYVPYVQNHSRSTVKKIREVKNDKGKVIARIPYTEYTHEIELSILWYRLQVDRSNKASVIFIGAAQGWRNEPVSRTVAKDDDDKESDPDWSAFTSIVDVSAYNIQVETKKIEAFRLTGEVTETTTFGVNLNLGNREGVGLDDTYWIEEMEENDAGEIVKNKRGFVKIREVGDNKTDPTAISYAQTITGTNYSPGLAVTELPLLGINGIVALGRVPITISSFQWNKAGFGSLKSYNFGASVKSETNSAFGGMVGIQTSLANATHISELWANLSGAIGLMSVDGKFYLPKNGVYNSSTDVDSSSDIGASFTWNVKLGLIKKFYFRRFGIFAQADLKYASTYLSATGKDKNTNDVTYKLTHSSFGIDGTAGLEIYLTPTLSIGGGAEYNIFPVTNSWTATATDKDNYDTKNSDASGPDVTYRGLGLFVWINYSLPSLK